MSQIRIASRALTAAGVLSLAVLAMPLPAGAQSNTVTPNASTAATPTTSSGQTNRATPRRAGGPNGVERRISDLHNRLQITPAQEDQWKQVADVMRQNAKDVEAVIKDRAQNAKTMTAVDNLVSYEKISAAHEEGMKRLIPPFQTLYSSMSDEQKKNADTVFRTQQQRRGSRAKQAS